MSKSTFINKKVLLVMVIIIALVGIGVGAYFIFKPKPDLKAPFENTYSLYNNETYADVLEFNQNLIDILNTTDFSTLSDEEKDSIQVSKYKYQIFSDLQNAYNSIEETLTKNLLFIEDKDNLLYKIQQSATKNYENIIESADECKNYINSYLKPQIIETYQSSEILWQKIDNYNNFYNQLFTSISLFYSDIGDIFYTYSVDTINANRYTKYNILTTVKWAEQTANLIINYSGENNPEDLLNASQSLKNFVNKNIVNPTNEYFQDADYYNYVLDCFNYVDFNDCITALACNNFISYANGLSDDLIKYAAVLQINYFMV